MKVTKSANKAVIDDAVDTKNTSVTLTGRQQCDEDDYGYESKASAGLYEKLMSKYEADPDDPMAKFSRSSSRGVRDMQGAKDRVKQALRREEDDSLTPGKRKRKKKDSFEDDGFTEGSANNKSSKKFEDKNMSEKKRREEEARRKRIENAKKAPPPVDFNSLLKLADEKKDIPVKIEKKVEKVKESEFGLGPMTKREKEEYIRDNKDRLRREGKLAAKEKSPTIPKLSDKKTQGSPEPREKEREKPRMKAEPGPSYHPAVLKSMPPADKRREDAERSAHERERKELEAKMKELERMREDLDKRTKIEECNRKKRQEYERKMEEQRRKQEKHLQERHKLESERRRLDQMKQQMEDMQRSLKEKEAKLSSGSSSSSSSTKYRDVKSVESRQFPGEKRREEDRRRKSKGGGGGYQRRLESDSEEDYDSEMDDFIDDSDARCDYSSEIRKIFG